MLSPDDLSLAHEIASYLATLLLPVSLFTLLTAMTYSTLMMLKGSTRAKDQLVREAKMGPGSVRARLFRKPVTYAEGTAAWQLFNEFKTAVPKMPDVKAMEAKVEALVTQFNAVVPLLNNLQGDALLTVMKQAYSDLRKGETLRGEVGLEGAELTPAEKQEIADLQRDPDGKATLIAAENLLDLAVDGKYLKPRTAAKIKKQLGAAFARGQPMDAILEPYKAVLDRLTGGGAPGVRLVANTGKGPQPL